VHRFVTVVFAVIFLTGLSAAQSSDRGELFGGFSYIHSDFSLTKPSGSGLYGWNASATFKVFRRLGVVGDFAGYYPGYSFGCGSGCNQSAKIHTFLFGPQASLTEGKVTTFVHFLFGDTNLHTIQAGLPGNTFTSTNSRTFGAGGGVDVGLTRRFAVRGQADWLNNGFQTVDDQRTSQEVHNIVRISTGLVFRF